MYYSAKCLTPIVYSITVKCTHVHADLGKCVCIIIIVTQLYIELKYMAVASYASINIVLRVQSSFQLY